jgi:hypothetical protein
MSNSGRVAAYCSSTGGTHEARESVNAHEWQHEGCLVDEKRRLGEVVQAGSAPKGRLCGLPSSDAPAAAGVPAHAAGPGGRRCPPAQQRAPLERTGLCRTWLAGSASSAPTCCPRRACRQGNASGGGGEKFRPCTLAAGTHDRPNEQSACCRRSRKMGGCGAWPGLPSTMLCLLC